MDPAQNGYNVVSGQQSTPSVSWGHGPSAVDPAKYLGPATTTLAVNPYDGDPVTHYSYPEAVKDSHLQARDDLTGFILDADFMWETTVALPWAYTAETNIRWDEWDFKGTLADRVPHEGVSRLISASKKTFSDKTVRRGLAFMMEGDYSRTPEGRLQYVQNVRSIAQSVQETQDHDTTWALLSCKDYVQMHSHLQNGSRVPFSKIYDEEKLNYGAVNTAGGASRLEVLIEEHRRSMGTQHVADTLILSPGTRIYLSMLPPERIEYYRAGPDGVMQRRLGPMSMGSIQGLNVFEARDYDVEKDSANAIQLLTRPIQVAEFYPIVFPREDTPCYDWTSKEMGCYMYDENVDDFCKVTQLQAFDNSKLFDAHGQYSAHVRRYVESLNAERRAPTPMDEESRTDPTLFVAVPDNDNKWMAARFFGQMEMCHMSALHVQRIGESMVKSIGGTAGFQTWNSFMRLITDLQEQHYDARFFTALSAANVARSVSSRGIFVGEATPKELAESHGVIPQIQWASNQYGSLDLPMENVGTRTLPVGYANGPGLRTLASHSQRDGSPWKAAGTKAAKALDMLNTMVEVMRQAMPMSAAFDTSMRAPWFHRADALTVFLDSVVGLSDAPMFLAHLPIVSGSGSASFPAASDAQEEGEDGESRRWFTLPGTVFDLPEGTQLSSTDLVTLVEAIRTGTPSSAATPRGPIRQTRTQPQPGSSEVVFKTASGATVSLPPEDFYNFAQYTPEIAAFGVMPAGTSPAAVSTRNAFIDAMTSLDSSEDRRKLSTFVMLFSEIRSKESLWAIISGLSSVDAEELPRTLTAITLKEGASQAERAAVKAQLDALASLSDPSDYEGLKSIVSQWRPPSQTPSREPGAFGYASIAEDVQLILDAERELLSQANPAVGRFTDAQTAYQTGAALAPATATLFASLGPSATADAARFQALQQQLTAATGRVDGELRRTNGSAAGESGQQAARRGRTIAAGSGGDVKVVVADDDASVASAAYYRTPLTFPRALVESLSTRFAGGFAKPLVLPADRSTAYTQPYAWHGEVDEARIPLDAALQEEEGRMSSLNLSEIFGSDAHNLDETALVRQLDLAGRSRLRDIASQGTSAAVRDVLNADISALSASSAFGDDDDDDEGAELSALASAQGKQYRSAADTLSAVMGSKRMRTHGASAHHHHHHHAHASTDHHARDMALARVRTGAFSLRFKQTSEIADPIVRLAARVFLMGRMDQASTWRMMIERNVIVPANFILSRPSIVHNMDTFIMMKAGLETGANFFGNANAGQNVDNVNKTIYYNFTFRSKAVVYNERNVRLLENMKFSGYLGGHNTRFMRNRNDLSQETAERPSLISMATSMTNCRFGDVLDLAGRPITAADGPVSDGEYSFTSAKFYDQYVWNLSQMRTTMRNIMRSNYFQRMERMTSIASVGSHFRYNRHAHEYNRFIAPKGHLKLNMAVPGGQTVMNGRGKIFPEFDYSAVHLT